MLHERTWHYSISSFHVSRCVDSGYQILFFPMRKFKHFITGCAPLSFSLPAVVLTSWKIYEIFVTNPSRMWKIEFSASRGGDLDNSSGFCLRYDFGRDPAADRTINPATGKWRLLTMTSSQQFLRECCEIVRCCPVYQRTRTHTSYFITCWYSRRPYTGSNLFITIFLTVLHCVYRTLLGEWFSCSSCFTLNRTFVVANIFPPFFPLLSPRSLRPADRVARST